MKIGDLVKLKIPGDVLHPEEHMWTGLIIDISDGEPIVYWNEQYSAERESPKHIWVIND